MISLVPKWAHEYQEFWDTIRRRNLWFIKLRYVAGVSLFIFLLTGQYIFNLNFSQEQFISIFCIASFIIIYNSFIQSIRTKLSCSPGIFNCMHLSLVQMLVDFTLLIILVYFTGTIESPLYMFFIFHTIIGSLILPGYLIYFIIIAVIMAYWVLVYLQYFNILDEHLIAGLYNTTPTHSILYINFFLTVFAVTMIVSVLIANRIAANLLKRESQLKDTLNELHEAETAKQKYIMGVVHEIKSPIAAVQSLINLVLQNYLGPVSEAVEKKLLRARDRADEAIQMINNVLRISKLKLLHITTTESLDILEMLKIVIDKQLEKAKIKNISINLIDERSNDKKVEGDKILLELAFSNVISNAVKYNTDNGKIEIGLKNSDSDLLIEIADNGIGIPEKDLDKIFNQFYRASNINKFTTEGSGLGLYLVLEIIDRHKGKLTVKSPSKLADSERKGTSVIIRLPYKIELDSHEDEIKTISLTGKI